MLVIQIHDKQQGQRVYVPEVVADNFQLLESKEAIEIRVHHGQSQIELGTKIVEQHDITKTNNIGFKDSQNPFDGQIIDINDDDLPF